MNKIYEKEIVISDSWVGHVKYVKGFLQVLIDQ